MDWCRASSARCRTVGIVNGLLEMRWCCLCREPIPRIACHATQSQQGNNYADAAHGTGDVPVTRGFEEMA